MKKILKYTTALFVGIGISLGGTAVAAQISVPSASSVGQLLTSLATGNWQASTSPTLWGTFTAKNFVATSTTAVSSFQQLLANGSTTLQNFTGVKSTTTNATTTSLAVIGTATSTFTKGIDITAGCFAIGGTCLSTGGAGTPGGADTQVQFNDAGVFGGEAGFVYLKSPSSQLFVPEIRSSTYSDPTGVTSLNLGGTDVTINSNGGLFKLNNGTAMLSLDTLSLTAPRTATFQDKDGTVAYLSDIGGSGASTTLLADNNTFSGSNAFSAATRFGNSGENITLQGNGFLQLGTGHPQAPFAVLSDSITFAFDGAADPATNGGGISFTANNGGTGDTNGGSVTFTTGLPSGTGATGTVKMYTGADLIFEGASSTVATSTFYSNLHVKGGLKIGDASILLQGNSTSTFSKGIELTGGCFKVAGACLSSGGSGASSTLHVDSNTFTGDNVFSKLTVTRSTTSAATSTNFFASDLWSTRLVTGNATATGVIAVQGTGTSTYTGGIRALTAQFDALNAASCDLKADTNGNMYCGTDATGGGSGSAASTTANFSIYKSGTTYYAYNSSTTVTTSNANFSTLLQAVVDTMDGSAGGGSIYIHAGTYYAGATTTIQGNGTAFSTPGGAIRIWGAGVGATKIVTTGNADFLAFDSVAVPMVSDMTIYVNGSSHALYADSSNNAVRSMWMFYFANMQITSTSSATAVPIYFGNSLRGLFSNIEFTDTAGCAYFYAEGNWNPGDFNFNRSFCELQTTSNLVAFNFGSTTSGGYMNQVHFDMIEAIGTGVGQTFMRGAPVKFSSFTNLNAEQFDILVDGYNATFKNEWDFNYATHRTGVANLKGCRFGNTLNGVAGQAVLNTCSFKFLENDANFSVVDDMNTDATRPNMIRGFFGSDAGSANASTGPSTLTVYRDISFYGTLDNNLAPSGLAGVFQVYGPLQTRSSKTASSSIRSDATSTFQTGINISTGCFAVANVCLSSSGSGASSTLLSDSNLFTGANIFNNITRSTTTAATTTNLFSTTASSTNLYTTNFFAGGLNTCNAANQALTYTNGLFGCNSAITAASSTLLANNNTFSGANSFATMLVTGSSTFQNFTALNATTTAATTTDLTVTDAPIFTALSGILKGNGSSPLTAAVNGTDFTLITAKTCTAGDFVSAVTAAGVFTCSTPIGGGGGGSGIGWTWNNINSLRMSTTTDDLLLGATATSSTAKLEAIDNGLLAWFASTTGATIRPIFTVFRDTTTGISGIGVNSSSTEDALTVNGRANFDPMLDGCDLLGIGTVTTDQLAGQLCDWLALDSVTDGGILMGTPSTGIEANMPFYTILRSGDTTSWAANEGVWLKSHRAVPATTTLMVEALLRTPNVNVATTTGTYVFGLGNVGAGSLTTTAAYAAPTDTCSFQASSTANWIAVVRKESTYNAWDVTVATSTTQSTFRRFRITQDLNNGCQFYVDGTLVASEPAATSPVVPMQLVLGEGNNGAGTGTIGTSQNHYFYFAEQKMGWGRWQPK